MGSSGAGSLQPNLAGAVFAGGERALLKPGRLYADAVERFQPYERIQEENPELRDGLVQSVERAVAEGRKLFAYVNNRAEGNAPLTIDAVLEKLEPTRGRRRR